MSTLLTPKEEQVDSEEKTFWPEFLVKSPPNEITLIRHLGIKKISQGFSTIKLYLPELKLFCNHEDCNGYRFFECRDYSQGLKAGKFVNIFLEYRCKNCDSEPKLYAIIAYLDEDSIDGQAIKLGEWPPFGPHTPRNVLKLFGPVKELFLKGRQSENQGLGIGAFGYYRRVVEHQWKLFINEIIKVAEKVSAQPDTIEKLKTAKKETQFGKAVKNIKDAIPQALLVNGHNPITLLHKALSAGLHAKTDKECLELATAIRHVLTELADRMGQALKDHAGLNAAVNRLMTPENKESE